jgi:hypothetical protein
MPVGALGSCGLIIGVDLDWGAGLDFRAGWGLAMIYSSV